MYVRFCSKEVGFIKSHTVENVEEAIYLLEQADLVAQVFGIEAEYWVEAYDTDEPDDVVPACFIVHDGEKYVVEYS